MKKTKSAWLFVILVSTVMLFSAGCTSPNEVGEEVLPSDDIIYGQFADTFTIQFKTLQVDTVKTEGLSRSLLGNYVDEEFGHLYAETYLQTLLTGSNLVFGNDPDKLVLDSIVLGLDLTGFYGRFNDPIDLEVFKISQDFLADSILGTETYLAFDSSYDYANNASLDFSNLNGFLDFVSFRLDDSLGNMFLSAPTDSLINNTAFTSFFKGLFIRSKPITQSSSREPGGIFQLDPTSDRTELTLYYKDSTSSKSYTFQISNASDRYHRIHRTDFSGRLLATIVADSNNLNNAYGAVESGAIVKQFVGIPGMTGIDPVGINRAELILPVDPDFLGSDNRFTPPTTLFLFAANETGTDIAPGFSILANGDYDPVFQRYVIPMTEDLQHILAGRIPDDGFIVVSGENGITMNRVVLGGPGHPDPNLRPRFRVVYTTLPQGG